MGARGGAALRSFLVLALAVAALPGPVAARRPVRYRVVELGMLSGANVAAAASLNNRGQLAGYCYTHVPPGHPNSLFGRPFLWEKGRMRELPPLSEFGHTAQLNDAGQVVGDPDTPDTWFPVIWNSAGAKPSRLSDEAGFAVAINARGAVLIHTFAVRAPDRKWTKTDRWWLKGRSGRISIASPDGRRIGLTGLSGQGEVIGYSQDDTLGSPDLPEKQQAFVWRDDKARWLPVPSGAASAPTDINERGVIVGWFSAGKNLGRACRWEANRRVDLKTPAGRSSSAVAVNRHGAVVGSVTDGAGWEQACLWTAGEPRLLRDLIPTELADRLGPAVDNNDRGQILVQGSDRHDRRTAWLLTPAD